MALSKAEEQLMDIIWENGKLFMKEIIECYPNPKPAATTIATLLKRAQDKGFVSYTLYGNSRQYYPLVEKDDYFSKHVKNMVRDFFGDSPLQFASFFTQSGGLSDTELEDLKKIVEKEIKKREQ